MPVAVLAAAAGLTVAALLGGLDEASASPELLGKGAEVDQARIRTRFEDAVVRPGGNGIGTETKRYLHVLLKVTNLSDATVSANLTVSQTIPTVRADGKTIKTERYTSGVLPPRVMASYRGQTFDQIHPRVTHDVVMLFDLPEDGAVPRKVELDVGKYEWREDAFYGIPQWMTAVEEAPPEPGETESRFVTRVVAKVEMPVRVEEAR